MMSWNKCAEESLESLLTLAGLAVVLAELSAALEALAAHDVASLGSAAPRPR